jgi:hypothetical protein
VFDDKFLVLCRQIVWTTLPTSSSIYTYTVVVQRYRQIALRKAAVKPKITGTSFIYFLYTDKRYNMAMSESSS